MVVVRVGPYVTNNSNPIEEEWRSLKKDIGYNFGLSDIVMDDDARSNSLPIFLFFFFFALSSFVSREDDEAVGISSHVLYEDFFLRSWKGYRLLPFSSPHPRPSCKMNRKKDFFFF